MSHTTIALKNMVTAYEDLEAQGYDLVGMPDEEFAALFDAAMHSHTRTIKAGRVFVTGPKSPWGNAETTEVVLFVSTEV